MLAKSLIFVALLGFQSAAFAEATMSLSLDLSSILSGGIGVRYEHKVLDYLTITVPVEAKSIRLSPLPNIAKNSIRIFWWSALPELTLLTGVGAKFHYCGWYVEPILKLGYAKIVYLGQTGTKNLFLLQPTLLFGYSQAFESGLFLNVGLGFSGRAFFPTQDAKSLVAPDGILAVGYAW